MSKNFLIIGLFLIACTFLQGCIGSKLFITNSNDKKKFPSLHSVPNRPKKQIFTNNKQIKQKKEQNYQKDLEENEKLRKEHNLS